MSGDRFSATIPEIQADELDALFNAWYLKRHGELWAGMDIDALLDLAMESLDVTDLLGQFLSAAFTVDADKRGLKIHEIKKRLIDRQLVHEKERGCWR